MNAHMTEKCPNHVYSGAPHIMGIVNVTPDSFSDGGQFFSSSDAIDHGLRLLDEGAMILDIGGESTRPKADFIEADEEIKRIIPVIKGLRSHAKHISVDTRKAKVMRAALDAGATAINDVSALCYDSDSINVVSDAQVPVFLMHSQGTPKTMQDDPCYKNVVNDIYQFLEKQISLCQAHGIDAQKIVIDPGIGFGKTLEHNLSILKNIDQFHALGMPILLGTSRKSFIAKASQKEPVNDRLAGSLASALWGLKKGVQIFRVHDVKETQQAFRIYEAIQSASADV